MRANIKPHVYELTGFDSSDFANYSSFVSMVNNNEIEYRDIKEHTNVALTKYEDNPNIGEYRYKNAKLKSLQFFNAAQNNNGYTSRFFEDLTYPLVLDKLGEYTQSY